MQSRLLRLGVAMLASVGLAGTGLVAAYVGTGDATPSTRAVWVVPSGAEAGGAPPVTPEAEETARALALAAPADPADIRGTGAWLFGWALLDRHTGRVTGSSNAATMTNTMESMIKPWFAADYLRQLAEAGQEPTAQALDELRLMIVDSHDPMGEKYYRVGGSDSIVRRLAAICDLKSVAIETTLWSFTVMSPADTVRYGQCLADGRAAGPRWTGWLLDTMKDVRGTVQNQISGEVQGGRWGIIDGLPKALADEVSIKNGWTSYKDGWHINCLAIHADWTLGVMLRTTRGLAAGADICARVAASLVVNPLTGQRAAS